MSLLGGLRLGRLMGGGTTSPAEAYIQKVLSYGPSAYYPLNEESGTIAHCQVNASQNGTYSASDIAGQSTFLHGEAAPTFVRADGDCVVLPHAALTVDGALGALMVWFRVSAAGIWTDGNFNWLFRLATATAGNYVDTLISSSASRHDNNYRAGAVLKPLNYSGQSAVTYLQTILTWNTDLDEYQVYREGVPNGSGPLSSLGAWAGTPNLAVIGAQDAIGSNSMDGNICQVAWWAGATLNDAAALDLASPLG